MEIEAYPLLDELTSKISTLNLERVRRLKSRLVALTRKVQKVLYICGNNSIVKAIVIISFKCTCQAKRLLFFFKSGSCRNNYI